MNTEQIVVLMVCASFMLYNFGASARAQASASPLTSQLEALLPNAEAGVAVGLIDKGEETVMFVGNPDFSEETLFEYGSITKVFTAIALAQLVDEGIIQLDESINPYLPEEVQDPKWESVTFEQLATHSAGLPPSPPNMTLLFNLRHGHDAYAQYDQAMLYEAVREVELQPTGELSEYSNFGFGLLGTLLADTTETSYADLIQTRIFAPLELTHATTTGWKSDNIAQPLDANGSKSDEWAFDALAGAGAVRGDLTDAVKFLKASMTACGDSAPLARANCQAQQATDLKALENAYQGLGWIRTQSPAGEIVWHNGGTGGFSTFLGFNVEKEVGLVLLANVAEADVTSVGLEYLASLE